MTIDFSFHQEKIWELWWKLKECEPYPYLMDISPPLGFLGWKEFSVREPPKRLFISYNIILKFKKIFGDVKNKKNLTNNSIFVQNVFWSKRFYAFLDANRSIYNIWYILGPSTYIF